MEVTACSNAGEFLARAGAMLMRSEAKHNLILRIARRLEQGQVYGAEAPYLLTVDADGEVLATAVRTPPYPVVVQSVDDRPEPLERIVDHLQLADPDLPGVNGTAASARTFSDLWKKRFPVRPEVVMRTRVFELREVTHPDGVPGRIRPALEGDVELLADWVAAFQAEAVPHDPPADSRSVVQRFMDSESLYVWDDRGPVSMAASSPSSERSATVNLVYTPPERREKGYASACVASLSEMLLDNGYSFCTLYADLSNLKSNRIYQRIGYCPVADWTMYRFVSAR